MVTIPAGMEHFTLPARTETLDFWGKLLDSTDTDIGKPRWAELRLYRIIDTNPAHDDSLPPDDPDRGMHGRQLWLLYTIGHSLVYHAAGGPCNRGVTVSSEDFPEHAEDADRAIPCGDCRPGHWTGGGSVSVEVTWYSWTPCRTAEAVLRALCRPPQCTCRHRPHRGRDCPGCPCPRFTLAPAALSGPGERLVEKIRPLDPEINAAASRKTAL